MTVLPFIDAHVHIWDLQRLRYPWLTPPFDDAGPNGSVAAIAQDFGWAQYRAALKRWGVIGVVHVEAGAHPEDALAETAWLEELSDAFPDAIVAHAALDDPNLEDTLAAQAAQRRVRGIRHIVNWHADPNRSYTAHDLTRDPRWQAGLGALAAHGLTFDLQCYPSQMPGLAELLAEHPDVGVAINHLGMPVLSDPDGVTAWRIGMKALAALPQVVVKISGLGFIRRDWTAEDVAPFVREAIELFGPGRCMIGSDAPTDMLFAPVDRYMETLHILTEHLNEAERRALFAGTADNFYRLEVSL